MDARRIEWRIDTGLTRLKHFFAYIATQMSDIAAAARVLLSCFRNLEI